MTKKQLSSVRQSKRDPKQDQARRRFDWDRVALWVGLIQLALLSVVFLDALLRQDTELIYKVLPVLIIALKLALQQSFNKKGRK